MKRTCASIAILLALSGMAGAQTCSSLYASTANGWRPVATAPRDGTVVEMLETYGIGPWYGLFKWTDKIILKDDKGKNQEIKTIPGWSSVDRGNVGVTESKCLFWRPYKPTSIKYIDPTGGSQESVEYWCRAAHRPYDPKTGYCK